MSAFFNSVFTSVSSAASALLTPEFWAVQWPLWRASILTCASILVFRFLFRSFVLKLTMYLKKRYHFDSIDSLVKAFNRPIQIYLLCLALYMFLINSPIKLFSEHSIIDNILRTSLIICFTWGIYNMCNAGHGLFVQIWKQSGLRVDKTVAEMVSALAHFLCILLGFAMIAEEWEYDITAFVASLGIGRRLDFRQQCGRHRRKSLVPQHLHPYVLSGTGVCAQQPPEQHTHH